MLLVSIRSRQSWTLASANEPTEVPWQATHCRVNDVRGTHQEMIHAGAARDPRSSGILAAIKPLRSEVEHA